MNMPELSHEYGGSRVDISDRSKIYGKGKVLDFSISRKISDIPIKTGNIEKSSKTVKLSKPKKQPNVSRPVTLVTIPEMEIKNYSNCSDAATDISAIASTIRKGAGTGQLIKCKYLSFFTDSFPNQSVLMDFVEKAKKRINKSFGILCYDVVSKDKKVFDNINQVVIEFAVSPECVSSALINSHLFQHRYCLFRDNAEQTFIYERLDFLAKKRVKKI